MFIFTAKLNKKKILYAVLAAAAVVVCAALLLTGRGDNAKQAATVSARGVGDNSERVAYLESFGWLVRQDPLSTEEVMIPDKLDDTYQAYVDLQAKQGFNLEKYCGKSVMRYTYEIINYPTGEAGITANLMIYKNKIIAGDVCSPAMNGFMHGLTYPGDD